jgi:Saxitoxin biosynthesis operon protein SxtJ
MNMHEDFSRKEAADGPSNRSFGLTLGIFFALVGLAPLLHSRPVRWWAVAPAAVLLIATAVLPSVLTVPNRLWMKLAWLISKITNPIVTGLMFYLLFTPVAIICRLMGKDLLRLKFDDGVDTYWIPRQPAGPPPETMRNQF